MARQSILTRSPAAAEGGGATPRGRGMSGRGVLRTTLSEQVYEKLKESILDQTLPAGTRLNIDGLSRDLNVSSSPIRESLARLEAERLVVSELYAGYSVAPQPSNKYLHELLDYRIVIEGHCAREGAPRRSPEILARLKQAVDRMSSVKSLGRKYREYRRFVEADMTFHQAIVDSSQNEVISSAYASLNPVILQSRLYLNRHGGTSRREEVMEEHMRILGAFESGDGEAAVAALREHLEGGRRRLLPQLQADSG